MATLPLYTPAAHFDGWHRVAAPGGYESWIFEADSSDGRTRFVVGFHLGWPMHSRYVQRYAWYRAMPTRVEPPIPAEFPVVTMQILRGDERRAGVACEFGTDEFTALDDRLDVRIGGNRASADGDGSVQLTLRGQSGKRTIAGHLTFTPVFRAWHEWVVSEHHRVLLTDPLCDVRGQLQVHEAGTAAPSILPMSGRGHRERRIGLRSLSDLRGAIVMARVIREREVTCARILDGRVSVVEMGARGAAERPATRETLRLDEPGWHVERMHVRALAWPGVGRWLGPRMHL